MRIAKFGHSCILVETKSGTRLLIDPGSMSQIPDDILAKEKIDAILITHSHGDHLDPNLIHRVLAAHPSLPVYGCTDIVEALQEKGIAATNHGFANFEVAGVTVETLLAGHDQVLGPVPENAAFRIDGELVVTGDSTSIALDSWVDTRVLALVTIAPWGARPQLAAMIDRLKPQAVFPVHDGFVKDEFLAWQDSAYDSYAKEREVKYLKLPDALTNV